MRRVQDSKGGGEGFEVQKYGDGRVALIGARPQATVHAVTGLHASHCTLQAALRCFASVPPGMAEKVSLV